MLYITTRDNKDAFTAHRALSDDLAPDGGHFIPLTMPDYDRTEIAALREKSFGQVVAEILNTFFSSRLTGWDVEFCIGRNVARLISMSHRITVAELWHNPDEKYSYIVNRLYEKIYDNADILKTPTDWVKIAIQIAVLFGLYGELLKAEITSCDQTVDISVSADGFSAPMAAWYARKMGLPIGTIICTCEENSSVWDLIHRGVFNTATAQDDLLMGIERLIQATLGFEAVKSYLAKCQNRQIFSVIEGAQGILNNGFFCAVAGENRSESIINSVFRSSSYVIDPCTALCYGGLQDYRARTGGSRMTLLLAERIPIDFTAEIAKATGIPKEKIVDYVNLS